MSNFPFGSNVSHPYTSQIHPAHVCPLSGPGTRPGIQPVIRDDQQRNRPSVSRFPVAFRRTGIRLLSHPAPAEELSVPHGRPTNRRDQRPDLNGVSTFPTRETRSGWMPSLPRGGGVLPAGNQSSARHPLLPNSQPYTPITIIHPWRLAVTRHQRRFTRFTRPIFLSPVPSEMKRRASGFPLSFAPHRYQQRTSG